MKISSKEALEELLYYANLNFERENEHKTEFANKIEKMGISDNKENFKIIEKDLERLEKLEKAFEVLKKSLLLSVVEIHEHYYVCAHDNNYFMKKEEADLIKEVIKNDK